MKIALDAAGGDYGIAPNIEGAIKAANEWGVEVILVGPGAQIHSQLSAHGIAAGDRRFEVVNAPQIIPMDADPASTCRDTPQASIMVGARLVAEGRAEGLVSAGHSGATMVASLWHLKRLPGVLRPAIAISVPTLKGHTILLDVGANTECKPWHLLQFAAMGALYCQHVFKVANPSVGILSVGEEECKGNDLVRESIPLLKCSGLNFYGPVEGRDITAGTTDVVVCDGFVGNIALKLIEGVASSIFGFLKNEIRGNHFYKAGGLLLRGPFNKLKKRLSAEEHGGAPLLGVGGTVIITHGRSNAKTISNALRTAKQLIDHKVNGQIQKSVADMKLNLETARVQPS
ncbi:MAG TPA: phosphate acyltransferase PlsX [Elusimicrobia bacterium]|nr:phosphate acyltransferase PlsX [Elusimicrobiota bacterium]HBT61748.1 phosphate acyltransferase PlsX [Elusimicrobiota bacterium]